MREFLRGLRLSINRLSNERSRRRRKKIFIIPYQLGNFGGLKGGRSWAFVDMAVIVEEPKELPIN
jgi:hypothetical protein